MPRAKVETEQARAYRRSMMASMDSKRQRLDARAELEHGSTAERTRAVIVRRQQNEILLAKARGELMDKDLVEKQASYLLVALRQRILSVPAAYARRILNIAEVKIVNLGRPFLKLASLTDQEKSILAEFCHGASKSTAHLTEGSEHKLDRVFCPGCDLILRLVSTTLFNHQSAVGVPSGGTRP